MSRPFSRRVALPLSAVMAGLLAACSAVGPNYELPRASAFAHVQGRQPALDTQGSTKLSTAVPAVEGRWWRLYDDPVLDRLVTQALDANTDLRVAAARLAQAKARETQVRAAAGVSEEVQASVGRGRVSAQSLLQPEELPPFNMAAGSVSVSYQLDLFGKIQRALEATQANVEATVAARDLTRISVAAAVVGAYVEACHANHEIEVEQRSLELQKHSRAIATRLRDAGRGTPVEVARADAQFSALSASLPPLQARRRAAGYELAALLGKTPDQAPAEAMACASVPQLRDPIPVGDGASLLRRRPDVRHAEREVAAATAAIGVATADLYPTVRLGASVGATGLLEDFGRPVTQQWSLGPLITWSIPGRGAHARVAAARAGAELAVAEFDHVVLDALRETQTVLDAYVYDLQRERALRQARDHAEAAANDERRLYEAGRRPYLSSLDADRSLASTESLLAQADAKVSKDQIRLFLALGGGWRDDEDADPPVASGASAAATTH